MDACFSGLYNVSYVGGYRRMIVYTAHSKDKYHKKHHTTKLYWTVMNKRYEINIFSVVPDILSKVFRSSPLTIFVILLKYWPKGNTIVKTWIPSILNSTSFVCDVCFLKGRVKNKFINVRTLSWVCNSQKIKKRSIN